MAATVRCRRFEGDQHIGQDENHGGDPEGRPQDPVQRDFLGDKIMVCLSGKIAAGKMKGFSRETGLPHFEFKGCMGHVAPGSTVKSVT